MSQITGRARLQIGPSPVLFTLRGIPGPTESRPLAPTERLQTPCLLFLTSDQLAWVALAQRELPAQIHSDSLAQGALASDTPMYSLESTFPELA